MQSDDPTPDEPATGSLSEAIRFVEVFQNKASGWAIGYLEDMPCQDGDVCLTEDMLSWRRLAAGGFDGSSTHHTVTLSDPEANDAPIVLTRVGDTLWWGGNAFERMEEPQALRPSVRPLPSARRPEYLFQDEHGAFVIYVSAAKYSYSYESFRLFMGTLSGEFREIPIRRVVRMRDGGTTYIHTEEGTLYSPSKFGHAGAVATWQGPAGHELREYDPRKFPIVETPQGVRIDSMGPGEAKVQR